MRKEWNKNVLNAMVLVSTLLVCMVVAGCLIAAAAASAGPPEKTPVIVGLNTHKSIYLPSEAAFIGIAVLDNEGHMVCDADVTLTITDPSDNETVLSTSNGLINVSPQCCVYGVTSLPDYYTNYKVGGAGTYVMNLTAVTPDGTKSITDEFTVQNSVDFDVARDGATRIYPPVPYVMNFTIKANKNYTGLIREYVPASFDITPQDGLIVTTVGDTKILTWNRNLVKGETYNIYYEFDAPDVSPYLFVLGDLEIGSFKEVRQWQIANDATVTYYFNTYSAGTAWANDPGNMVDGIEDSYASTTTNNDVELLTGNTCPGTGSGTITKVEIRAYGYDDPAGDDTVALVPVFAGGSGDSHPDALPQIAGWGQYFDITGDPNAPSPWTWSNVQDLDCDVEYIKVGQGTLNYVGKVEIIVSYTLITSCDSAGNEINQFAPKETVYVKGDALDASTNYKIWIQYSQVNEGDPIISAEDPSTIKGDPITTNAQGDFSATPIWSIPEGAAVTNTEYDIVVDNQVSGTVGTYNAADDGLDSATVAGIVAPVPDVSSLILFASGLVLVSVYFVYGRRREEEGAI